MDIGARQHGERRCGVLHTVDHSTDAADDARLHPVALANQACIEAGLPAERFGKRRRADVDADRAPRPEPSLQKVLRVFGLVAAMEGADADMRHARLQLRAVVGGTADRWRQAAEQMRAEPAGLFEGHGAHRPDPATHCS